MPGIGLKKSEINAAFDTRDGQCPSILDVDQVMSLLGVSRSTLYEWLAKGRFDGAYRRRGKRLFFWRDRVIDKLFNGPDWASAER